MFKKLSASSFELSVWCLYQITNLSFFPGTFHFAQRLVFGRFLSAWKGVHFGQVKIWELGLNLLEDFFKWQLFFYDCFGGLWLPRRASVYPLWHFLWACWWHSEKPSSYSRNKLTRWVREFLKPFSSFPPPSKSQWSFSIDCTNQVCVCTSLKCFHLNLSQTATCWNSGLRDSISAALYCIW